MHQLLIVEDSKEISEPLLQILKEEGFTVTLVESQRAATKVLETEDAAFDLALVDLSLPDGHGFSVFHVAQEHDVPVIFLTANDDEYMISGGLDMGAVDYVTKPYRKRELVSRINRILKDRGKLSAELTFGDLRVDTAKGNAYKNGEELYLSRLEYRLLLLFMNNPGKLFTRDALLDEIWDVTGEYISDNTLTVHIKRLREKLGDDAQDPQMIKTVRGMGYKLGE